MDSLPPLREELELFQAEPDAKGDQFWTIYDPVRNQYFKISHQSLLLMRYWSAGSAEQLLKKLQQKEGVSVDIQQLEQLWQFLQDNQLLVVDSSQETQSLIQRQASRHQSLFHRIVHGYLFFRIPLVKPDRFLEKLLTVCSPVLNQQTFYFIGVLGLLGGYLTVRQWDEFINTAVQFFNPAGLFYFLIALVFTKILHELGHGVAAKYYGCRVPTMGVAFLVMFPVLYTDTTDSWRLSSYQKRIRIGAAGLLTELSIACIALFLWPFLPDGAMKNAVFMLAAVTWVTSLLVNLNPFMRFDGYYLLSDWWRIDNLQHRAFALARWQLREWLFDLQAPMQESWSHRQRRKLLIYAYGTWIYRFLLFLGIALLVYHFFFKALGLVLFFIEIVWLIARPVYHEVRFWWQQRDNIHWNRKRLVLTGSLLTLLLMLFVPFNTTLNLPAVMTAEQSVKIYPPQSGGQVDKLLVEAGQEVKAGQPLFKLVNPDLAQRKRLLSLELELTQTLLNRKAADLEYQQLAPVLLQRKASLSEELSGVQSQQNQLTVQAPFTGRVVYLDQWLAEQQWLQPNVPVLQITQTNRVKVEAYVPATDLHRIKIADKGWFYPDDIALGSVEIVISQISPVSSRVLETEYLSSDYGGPIEIVRDAQRQAVPVEGLYRVILNAPSNEIDTPTIQIGNIHIEVEGKSVAEKLWYAFWGVIIRESGF